MNDEKILMVDDDPNVLSAYKRSLYKKFHLETALGPELALETIHENSFAIIVSDLKMPEMDGIQFLTKVKEDSPNSIRMMLTGYAEVNKAIEAVNEGNIFRFLTKPCDDDTLSASLEAGLKQYRLVMAERELLEKTLKGSIDILTEMLSMYHPEIFGRTVQLCDLIRTLAQNLKIKSFWEIEVAAMLSPIGYVGIPPEIIVKTLKEQDLSNDENEMVELVPEIGAHFLANIPRLMPVSKIIFYQCKNFDGTGFPKDSVLGGKIPMGSRIIKPLSDMLEIEKEGISRNKAIDVLKQRTGWYDPLVLEKIVCCFFDANEDSKSAAISVRSLKVGELKVDQVLNSNVFTQEGKLLLSAGQRLTHIHLQRLRNYSKLEGLQEPIQVRIEAQPEKQDSVDIKGIY
ncbi:MAG: response regulator [Nitrospina sp.]|nr:response regulator [Nitrospina sp.]MBT5632584.1 response regulator [Nitrospina sp.]